jgi:hypothetical protein
LRNK